MADSASPTPPILGYASLRRALVVRLMGENPFDNEKRSHYVGGSEVGGCPRQVCYSKTFPPRTFIDPKVAGRLLRGNVMEEEAVHFVRGVVGDALLATGENQTELGDGTLKSHPDGLFAQDSFTFDPGSVFFKANAGKWKVEDLIPLAQGKGVFEAKAGSHEVFKDVVRNGLSEAYQDQAQVNMGLSDSLWTLLFYVSAENYSDMALFFIPANPARFAELQHVADSIMGTRAVILSRLSEADLLVDEPTPEQQGVIDAIVDSLLPPGDADRGWCNECPLSHRCPALGFVEEEPLPPEVEMEAEAQGLIYLAAKERMDAAEEEKKDAGAALKAIMRKYQRKAAKPGLVSLSLSTQEEGKESCAFRRLETDHPAAFADCVSRGEGFDTLRVSRRKK